MTSLSIEPNYTNNSASQCSASYERIQIISSKIDVAPLPVMNFKLMGQAPKLPCRQVSVDQQSKQQNKSLSLPFQRSEPTPMNFKLMAHAPRLPCRQVSVDPPQMPMKQALSTPDRRRSCPEPHRPPMTEIYVPSHCHTASDRRYSCPETQVPPITEIYVPCDSHPSQIKVDPKVVMIDHDLKNERFKGIATKLKSIPRPPKLPSRQLTEERT